MSGSYEQLMNFLFPQETRIILNDISFCRWNLIHAVYNFTTQWDEEFYSDFIGWETFFGQGD